MWNWCSVESTHGSLRLSLWFIVVRTPRERKWYSKQFEIQHEIVCVFFVSDKAQETEFDPSLYKTLTSRRWLGKVALKKNELTGHLWWSERNIMLFILLVSSLLKCWRHYNFPIISPGCSFVHKRAFLFHGLFGWRLIPRKSLVCLSKWLCLYFEEILHLKFLRVNKKRHSYWSSSFSVLRVGPYGNFYGILLLFCRKMEQWCLRYHVRECWEAT